MFADALVIPQLYCKRIGAATGVSALPLKFSQGDFELFDDARYVAFIGIRARCADFCLVSALLSFDWVQPNGTRFKRQTGP
ncbi:hypothetical protein PsWM33_03849 [Pseudovibrio sp. WM33]|nr:hypothetical protein PsWM33_03849 [Pseudovibrio sp. WM33]